MATHELVQGAVDLNAAASWSSATAPGSWTDGDTVIMATRGEDVTTNPTAMGGKDLVLLRTDDGFNRDLGSPAAYVKVNANRTAAGKLILGHAGDSYIEGGTVDATITTIEKRGGGRLWLKGVVNATLKAIAGVVRVLSDSTVSAVRVDKGASVDVETHGSDVVDGACEVAGTLIVRRRLSSTTTRVKNGGVLEYDVDENSTGSGQIIVEAGGTLRWKRGMLSVLLQSDGTLDALRLAKGYDLTITDHAGSREIYGITQPSAVTRTTPDSVGSSKEYR